MWLRREFQRLALFLFSTLNFIVLSLEHNFFEIFEITEAFELDEETLEDRYHKLQNETHPDRFAGAEEQQKLQAVQLNSYLNEAYVTLKSPLKRAGYLLQRNGIDPESVDQKDLDMELLLEQMQLRESLADLPKDESALEQIDKMKRETQKRIRECESRFTVSFSEGNLQLAKKVFHELQFLNKLLNETEQAEEHRLGY